MTNIFQHILIGVGNAGDAVLGDISRSFHFHGLPILSHLSLKIRLSCEGGIKVLPFDETKDGRQGDEANRPEPPGKDPECRRSVFISSGEGFRDLEEALRSEWKRAGCDEIVREVTRSGLKIRGRKVFIFADLGVGTASSLIIPLMAMLRYALRNEDIPDIHWNIIGFTGISDDPAAKLHTYAILRELAYLKSHECPAKINLATGSTLQKELPLAIGEYMLYLIEARSRGVAPLSVVDLANLTSRYIFIETFSDFQTVIPPDRELYFHSFGAGECYFPLSEILESFSARLSIQHFEKFKKVEAPAGDAPPDSAKIACELPDYRKFKWSPFSVAPGRDKSIGADAEKLKELYKGRERELEGEVRKVFGKSAEDHPFHISIKKALDDLMRDSFFDVNAARGLLAGCGKTLQQYIEELETLDEKVPPEEEMTRRGEEIASSERLELPVMVSTFIFLQIPFGASLYEFLMKTGGGGNSIFYKTLITLVMFIIAFAGAYARRASELGALTSKIRSSLDIFESYYRGNYHKNMKPVIRSFYNDLLSCLTGRKKEGIGGGSSLMEELGDYSGAIRDLGFSPPVTAWHLFGAIKFFDPEVSGDMDIFSREFLGRIFESGDFSGEWRKLYDEMKNESPGWREIMKSPAEAVRLFEELNEKLLRRLRELAKKSEALLWNMIIEKGGPLLRLKVSKLLELSAPLVNQGDNTLKDENNISGDIRILYLPLRDELRDCLKEMTSHERFQPEQIASLDASLISLHLVRFRQIYKLADLSDWRYFEGKLSEEMRRDLYLCDEVMQSPHIDYASRAGGAS